MDQRTFAELYREYYPRVLSYVRKRISSLQESEDLTQDIFVRCYQNFDSFDENRAKFSTWLYTIVNHRLIDYYRVKKDLTSLDDPEIVWEPESEDDVEDAILMEEQNVLLRKAIAMLSDRERALVEGKYFFGKGAAEMAEELGITPGNARVALHRALLKMKDILEGRL